MTIRPSVSTIRTLEGSDSQVMTCFELVSGVLERNVTLNVTTMDSTCEFCMQNRFVAQFKQYDVYNAHKFYPLFLVVLFCFVFFLYIT